MKEKRNIKSRIFIVAPCILIKLMFLSSTNAPLYYTYKMLKYTVKNLNRNLSISTKL